MQPLTNKMVLDIISKNKIFQVQIERLEQKLEYSPFNDDGVLYDPLQTLHSEQDLVILKQEWELNKNRLDKVKREYNDWLYEKVGE